MRREGTAPGNLVLEEGSRGEMVEQALQAAGEEGLVGWAIGAGDPAAKASEELDLGPVERDAQLVEEARHDPP